MVRLDVQKRSIEDKLVELMGRGFLTEEELQGKLLELQKAKSQKETGRVIKGLLVEEMLK